ncbi:MAG: patatin-like phospholipase family protein [Methyloligellaceae bacterium]
MGARAEFSVLSSSVIAGAALSLIASFLLAACAGGSARNPVPDTLTSQATAIGMADIRFWGDASPPNLNDIVKERLAQTRAARPELLRRGSKQVVSFLTLSGGGSDGAFGAGLLVGWTASGTRPVFEIVTGVSTGALIAPFAFLGSRYDPVLKEMYTTYTTRDFVRKRPVQGLLGGSSLASNKGLAELIAKYVDRKFLAEIAAAHNSGRRLLVGTTNLDAQRPVTWDMGKIAASGNPEAIFLFRNVLLASAAIPGAFPPVFIHVKANGRIYDEMHVDGGATNQVFFLPNQLMVGKIERTTGFRPKRRLYVIRNGRVGPEHKPVEAATFSIASRSVSTMIKYQGIGDLFKMYEFARRNAIQYRLAYIPADFEDTSTEPFDVTYMRALFDLGYRLGKAGYKWRTKPPGSAGR